MIRVYSLYKIPKMTFLYNFQRKGRGLGVALPRISNENPKGWVTQRLASVN